MIANGIHVRPVIGDTHLLAIDRHATPAMTAVVKMRHRQELGQLVPNVTVDVPVADEPVTQQRRGRRFCASGGSVLPDVETSAVAT
jgi:hypothetical protein